MTTEGFESVFKTYVPDWRFKSAAEFRNRRLTELSESIVALLNALGGG